MLQLSGSTIEIELPYLAHWAPSPSAAAARELAAAAPSLANLHLLAPALCAEFAEAFLAATAQPLQRLLLSREATPSAHLLDLVARRGKELRELQLRASPASLPRLLDSCGRVEVLALTVSLPHLPDEQEAACAALCRATLRSVAPLRRLSLDWASLDDAALRQLGAGGLDELALTRCAEVSDAGLRAAAAGLRALRLEALPSAALRRLDLSAAAPRLRALRLGALPQLEALSLAGCAALRAVEAGAPLRALRALSLRGCASLADAALHALPPRLPALEALELRGCAALRSVALAVLPALSALDVRDCARLASLRLQRCPRLAVLLCERCPALGTLECRHARALRRVDVGAAPPPLRALLLPSAAGLADADAELAALCRAAPGLTDVDVSYTSVGDAGVAALARHCPGLATLSLRNCRAVSAAGLHALADGCAHLASLDLRWCSKVDAARLPSALASFVTV